MRPAPSTAGRCSATPRWRGRLRAPGASWSGCSSAGMAPSRPRRPALAERAAAAGGGTCCIGSAWHAATGNCERWSAHEGSSCRPALQAGASRLTKEDCAQDTAVTVRATEGLLHSLRKAAHTSVLMGCHRASFPEDSWRLLPARRQKTATHRYALCARKWLS